MYIQGHTLVAVLNSQTIFYTFRVYTPRNCTLNVNNTICYNANLTNTSPFTATVSNMFFPTFNDYGKYVVRTYLISYIRCVPTTF